MKTGVVVRGVIGAGFVLATLAACRPQLVGAWQVTAVCPPQSHLGAITIAAQADVAEQERGLFIGTITNDLGESGQFTGQIEDNTMTVKTSWAGQRPTESLLVFDRRSKSFEGMDSNGCALTVVRP